MRRQELRVKDRRTPPPAQMGQRNQAAEIGIAGAVLRQQRNPADETVGFPHLQVNADYRLQARRRALLALIAIIGTYVNNYYAPNLAEQPLDYRLLAAVFEHSDIFSTYLAALLLIWTLTEICYMFLTKRRNQYEKELAAWEAKARAWYESIKDHLPEDAPPPPFATNSPT